MSLILSKGGSNAVEMFATRIDVQWDFRTNTGPVLFHFERVNWDRGTKLLNTSAFERTVRDDMAGLIGGQYTLIDPVTGETLVEPGWKLMAMIKAATERVWDAEAGILPSRTSRSPVSDDDAGKRTSTATTSDLPGAGVEP